MMDDNNTYIRSGPCLLFELYWLLSRNSAAAPTFVLPVVVQVGTCIGKKGMTLYVCCI